jgi:hypothetical protein
MQTPFLTFWKGWDIRLRRSEYFPLTPRLLTMPTRRPSASAGVGHTNYALLCQVVRCRLVLIYIATQSVL